MNAHITSQPASQLFPMNRQNTPFRCPRITSRLPSHCRCVVSVHTVQFQCTCICSFISLLQSTSRICRLPQVTTTYHRLPNTFSQHAPLATNKTDKVRVTQHWGGFTKPLLSWKSSKYYILVCVCMWVPEREGVCMRIRAYSLANPARNAYAPYCDVICGPSMSTIFFDIIS